MQQLLKWTFFIILIYVVYQKMVKPVFFNHLEYLYDSQSPLKSFSVIRENKVLFFENIGEKWIMNTASTNIPLDNQWVDSILNAFTSLPIKYQKSRDELDFKLYGLDENNTAILTFETKKSPKASKSWAIGFSKEDESDYTWIRPIGSKDIFLIQAPLYRWLYQGVGGLVPEDNFLKRYSLLQQVAFFENHKFVNGANKGKDHSWCNAISKPKIEEEDWETYFETIKTYKLTHVIDFDTIINKTPQIRSIEFYYTPPIPNDKITVWGTKENTDSCIMCSSFRNNLFYKISVNTFEQVFWKPLKMK